MDKVTAADVVRVVGPTTDFVVSEILRTGALLADLRRAVAIVASRADRDLRVSASLEPHMRRLIDLVAVAGLAKKAERATAA